MSSFQPTINKQDERLASRLKKTWEFVEQTPAESQSEQEEKDKIKRLLYFHITSALEWISPEGYQLRKQDPKLFEIWQKEATWLMDEIDRASKEPDRPQ